MTDAKGKLHLFGDFQTWGHPDSRMVYFMENPAEKMDENWKPTMGYPP